MPQLRITAAVRAGDADGWLSLARGYAVICWPVFHHGRASRQNGSGGERAEVFRRPTPIQGAATPTQEAFAEPGKGHGIGGEPDAPDAPTTPRRGIAALPGLFLYVETLLYHLEIRFRITPKDMRRYTYHPIRTRRGHGFKDFDAIPRPASRRFMPCRKH